jgi:single-strand DNA-binding protein
VLIADSLQDVVVSVSKTVSNYLNYTNGGTPVINLSVANNRQKKNGEGEKVSVADWYRVTVFGRDAEIISQYAKKGSALAFNGRLQTDSYTDREGQQRTSTYLIADSFEFVPLPKRADEEAEAATPEYAEAGGDAAQEDNKPGKKRRKTPKPETDESDIPF